MSSSVSDMIAIMSDELNSLLQGLRGHECEFAAGASVFHLGDPVRVVHFVRRGTIHLVRHQEDGAALILQRARAGSILAEASVYSESYHCDARAESDAATWAVARKDLRRRLEAKPEVSELGRNISRMRSSARGSMRKSSRSRQSRLGSTLGQLGMALARKRAAAENRRRDWRQSGGSLPRDSQACAARASRITRKIWLA